MFAEQGPLPARHTTWSCCNKRTHTMPKKLLFAILFLMFATPIFAQQQVNGDQTYIPGAWIGTQVPNAASTGTTVNKLAKLTGTGTAVITATTDTSGILGIVGSGAGTTGNASIVQSGQVPCAFSTPTTANDFV